jgi:serine/threonine-protein kinase
MGAAHLVEHRRLGTRFVGKVLRGRHRNNPGLIDRMRVEAQSLARLTHSNVVRVFDFDFTSDGRPFIIMESLKGQTLAHELRERGELPCLEAATWLRQLLGALAAAHGLGLVHRDVKLDNLFLHDADDGQRILKVLDFGIAKIQTGLVAAGVEPPQVPTHAGAIVGTPRFLSPEAAQGLGVDHRADIYSAGVVLYMLLCGRGPWDDARSHASVFEAQTSRVPLPPSAYARQAIPEALDAVTMTAMRIDPEERFQAATAFDFALETIVCQLRSAHSAATEVGVRLDVLTRSATFEFPAAPAAQTELLSTPAPRRSRKTAAGLLAFVISAVVTAALAWLPLGWLIRR